MQSKFYHDTRKMVLLAILTAVVITLQVLAAWVPVYPFKLNLALIPIVIAASMISPLAACWLGIVFGTVVLLTSPDVIPFMVYNPLATVFVVLLRGAFAGLFAAMIYKLLEDKNKTIAVIAAAVICATTNTAIFILAVYAFFLPVLEQWGIIETADIAFFVFVSMVGVNFLIEFGINLVFSPVIVRLLNIHSKMNIRG